MICSLLNSKISVNHSNNKHKNIFLSNIVKINTYNDHIQIEIYDKNSSCIDDVPDNIKKKNQLDSLLIYKYSDIKKEIIRNKILSSHKYYCITFNSNVFINESYNSYKNTNIYKQFCIDFPRTNLLFNNSKCDNISAFLSNINKFKKYKHYVLDSCYDLIILLCTQTTFFYSFNIIHELYSIRDTNLFVLSDNDRPIICVNTSIPKQIEILFNKNMKLINIQLEKSILLFYTTIKIIINLDEQNSNLSDNINIYWTKNSNLLIL